MMTKVDSDLNAGLKFGISLIQNGRLLEAEKVFNNILRSYPRQPDATHLLGISISGQGRKREAVKIIKKAIRYSSRTAVYHRNLGIVLKEMGKLNDAIRAFKKAISLDNKDSQSHNELGIIYSLLGRSLSAISEYKISIAKDRTNSSPLINIGNEYLKNNDTKEAINAYKNALVINNKLVDGYYGLGSAYSLKGDAEEAIVNYNKAIMLDPGFKMSFIGLGKIFLSKGSVDKAISILKSGVGEGTGCKELYYELGVAMKVKGCLDEAVDALRQAIEIDGGYKEAYNALGGVLKRKAMFGKAIAMYEKAINIEDTYNAAHLNLSYVLLLYGNYKQGWRHYEKGRNIKDNKEKYDILFPIWGGGALDEKVILISSEQGIGDVVMFSSCVADLVKLSPKQVLIKCDHRLDGIFKRSFPMIDIYHTEDTSRVVDLQIPIGSLPQFFRKEDVSFPGRSFLVPDRLLVDKWSRRYSDIGHGLKVGISWRGGGTDEGKNKRSIDLKNWEAIFGLDAHFINLQYGDCREEIDEVQHSAGVKIHDWDDSDPLVDLDDFVAKISTLDLVVSVDNSTVHFSGAVGVNTWVLLPFVPDWRWGINTSYSPWYESAKLFRQQKTGGWGDVMDDVYMKLGDLL